MALLEEANVSVKSVVKPAQKLHLGQVAADLALRQAFDHVEVFELVEEAVEIEVAVVEDLDVVDREGLCALAAMRQRRRR